MQSADGWTTPHRTHETSNNCTQVFIGSPVQTQEENSGNWYKFKCLSGKDWPLKKLCSLWENLSCFLKKLKSETATWHRWMFVFHLPQSLWFHPSVGISVVICYNIYVHMQILPSFLVEIPCTKSVFLLRKLGFFFWVCFLLNNRIFQRDCKLNTVF